MNSNESAIVTSMTITAVSVTLGQVAGGNAPKLRPVVGVVVGGFILLAGANSDQFGPLSVQFATLIATTAVLTTGVYTITALARYFTN